MMATWAVTGVPNAAHSGPGGAVTDHSDCSARAGIGVYRLSIVLNRGCGTVRQALQWGTRLVRAPLGPFRRAGCCASLVAKLPAPARGGAQNAHHQRVRPWGKSMRSAPLTAA